MSAPITSKMFGSFMPLVSLTRSLVPQQLQRTCAAIVPTLHATNTSVNGTQIQSCRWLGNKSGRLHKRPFVPGKYGLKKYPGEYVERGMILHRQLGLKIYPGENVGCGRDCTLFALEPGRVVISTELLTPYPDSPLYPAVKAGRKVYKQFYHILPEEQHQRFRLVSQV